MNFFLYSLVLLSVSALLIVLTSRFKNISGVIFLISLGAGCVLGFASAIHILVSRGAIDYRLNFRMPWGEFYIGIDPLSAFFLLTITILFFLAGIYGYGYFKKY